MRIKSPEQDLIKAVPGLNFTRVGWREDQQVDYNLQLATPPSPMAAP